MIDLLAPAACLAAMLVLVYRERRLYLQHLADADDRLRGHRQERAARSAIRPRTGDVAAAPRLAPLADVLPFPDRDGDAAA